MFKVKDPKNADRLEEATCDCRVRSPPQKKHVCVRAFAYVLERMRSQMQVEQIRTSEQKPEKRKQHKIAN